MRVLGLLGLWILTAGLITGITLHAFFSRTRMSHENGIECKGKIKILDNLDIPPCGFFEPGKTFPCRFRHASVSFADDARLVVRSASLKFSDTDHDSPLDIMMNSGTKGPFAHAGQFLKFAIATTRGREQHLQPYLHAHPAIANGIVESICYPDTFALLNYHSKTPMGYRDANGTDWYIKFKLAPWDRGPDRGRPSEKELEQFWLQAPKPGETRSRNFLKDEFRRRVAEAPVKYHLQAQFHEVVKNEDREILNCAIAWNEDIHPWLDLAEVEVHEIMPSEEGNLTWYDICNHPPSMSVPRAWSIEDPASINYLREKDSWAKNARIQSYKWRGQLPPLVDDRNNLRSAIPRICLPQDELTGSYMRSNELISKRDIYLFSEDDGTPPHARHLPECEDFTTSESRNMIKDIAYGVFNSTISRVETLLNKRNTLADFDRLYPYWQEPSVSKRFGSDLEFGRQRLNGVNPILIKRCSQIPDNFPVTDDLIAGLMEEGDTLASVAASKRLYLLDHVSVDGIERKNGYLPAPMTLFFCNTYGHLMPLAIQLEQEPGPGVPIFTPKDPYWLWTTVKTYVQCADAAYHEVASHLLRTHMVMETFAVSMHRRLHERHPIYQFLEPHFHATMAINHSARSVMLAPGGPIDKTLSLGSKGSHELMKREYAKWDFSICTLPLDLTNRGVDDREALPHYFYRDDGLMMWEAISTHVGAVVDFWYSSDAAIASDAELQAWISELLSADGGKVRGLPNEGQITNYNALKQLLAGIVFTTTAEHSSVNNGQYAMFGYPPNLPCAMYKPWPTSKEDSLSEKDFVSRLPNHSKSYQQLQMAYLLSQRTRWVVGDFEKPYFHGIPEMWSLVRNFRDEMHRIANLIEERNRGLEFPYDYLNPRQISESIAI